MLRATVGEEPADPVDAPGEMWRDYRIFDEHGDYWSQHSCGEDSFDDTVERLKNGYTGDVVVKLTGETE